MKKFIILLMVLFCSANVVLADDVDLPSTGDLWDNWGASQDFYGQDKSISDEQFDKTIDALKSKKNKRAERLRKKQMPKGEEFSQANETDVINEQADDNSLPVVCIPVELELGNDGILPVGHYQVMGEKKDDKVVLKLYQAQYLMAELPAVETGDDFEQDTITFAQWFLVDSDTIKIVYGSIDFNAYALAKIKG